MLLQQVFIAVSLWGWYQWKFGGPEHGRLPVSRLSRRGLIQCTVGWLASFAVLALFLSRFTDTDVPLTDGFLTAGSLVGQLLLSRKKIENWHVWIAVDLLYVGLYVYKKLFLTAILYAIFIALAVAGLRAWQRACAPAPA
jgi:nicotinamide mononucleotide transporter